MFKAISTLVLLLSSTLAFSQCLGNLCIGDVIMNQSNDVGTVTAIKEGKVSYETRNGWSYDASPSSLSARIDSQKFPVNKKVINDSNDQGKVLVAFADGRVQYETNNGWTYVSRTLSPEVEESRGLRAGMLAINPSNDVGTVKAAFENGKVAYETLNGWSYVSSTLEPEVTESNGIVKGTRIINRSNDAGTAKAVFRDGRVSYETTNGWSYVSKELVPETDVLPNGIKSGTIVLNRSNDVGTASHVYRDGRIEYETRNGWRYVSNDLSPEVANHPKYQKNVTYASNSDIGEVVRFFGNEKIEFGDSNSICDTLYEEVEEVEGIKAESEVVSLAGEGKVESIFANRMAKIKLEKDSVEARVLKEKDIESDFIRSTWLQGIFYKLNEKNVRYSNGSAVEKKHYKKLLDLLKVDLNKRDSQYKGDAKKKMNDFLDSELKRIQPVQAVQA